MLKVFTQRNFVADFIRLNLNFIHKMTNLLLESPFGGVRGNVRTSSIAHWKARGRLALIEHFSLALTVERFKRYEQILVEVGVFQRGVGRFKCKF